MGGGQNSQVMVMKFRVEEGGEKVAVDSFRGIGVKSKSSGKTCIEDVVATAAKALLTPGATISPSAKFLFDTRSKKKTKVKTANRTVATEMSMAIKGENKLEEGELRLGNIVYRGVKIVPPSSDD